MNRLGVRYLVLGICVLMFFWFVSGAEVDDSIYERFDDGEDEVRVIVKVNNDSEVSGFFGFFGFGKSSVEDVVGTEVEVVGNYFRIVVVLAVVLIGVFVIVMANRKKLKGLKSKKKDGENKETEA